MASKIKDIEIETREREPPQAKLAPSESVLKEAVIKPNKSERVGGSAVEQVRLTITNAAAFSSLNSKLYEKKNTRDLSQFSKKNIVRQRKNDILSEKAETQVRSKSYNTAQSRNIFVDTKIAVQKERTSAIKAEFGSIEKYNNFKNAPKIESNRQSLIKSKKRLATERRQLIKAEYGGVANYREAQSIIDSESRRTALITEKKSLIQQRNIIVDSGDMSKLKRLSRINNRILAVDGKIKSESAAINSYFAKRTNEIQALKASSGNREEFVKKRRSLYGKSERLNKVDNRYSRLTRDIDRCTEKLKTVTHTAMPESVIKAHRKYAYFDGKINKFSDKLRQHSSKLENILAERSDSKYFRAGFTAHQRSSVLSEDRLERNAAKAEIKLDKASRRLPKHTIIRKSYQFNAETGQVNKTLILEKEVKPLTGNTNIVAKALKGAGAVTALRLSRSIHSEISKNENELGNEGVKMAHTAERFAEHTTVKAAKHAHKFLRERPYKKVSRLQYKSDKANAKLYAKRNGGTARQMKQHSKQYMNKAKKARKAATNADKLAQAVRKIGVIIKKALFSKPLLIILGAAALIVLLVMFALTFISAIGGNIGSVLGAYLSEDSQIYSAENYAKNYEAQVLQDTIDGIMSNNSGLYDVVVLEPSNPYYPNRNPYNLTSFLSAYSFVKSGDEYDNSFTVTNDIKQAIETFIDTYYYIEYIIYNEVRTRKVYDANGNEVEETYTAAVLKMEIKTQTADETAELVYNSGNPYEPSMYEVYLMYMETKGFREYLFPNF